MAETASECESHEDDDEDDFPEPDDDDEPVQQQVEQPTEYVSKTVVLRQSKSKKGKYFVWHSELQSSDWVKYTCADVSNELGLECTEFKLGCHENVEYVYPYVADADPATLQKFCETASMLP